MEGGGKGRARLKRGYRSGDDCESCGRGDGGVDFIPDDLIGLIVEDCLKERYDTVNVEVARVDR